MRFLLLSAITPLGGARIVHRLSLLDCLRQAGVTAMPCIVLSLLLIAGGVMLIVLRPRLSIRLGYSVFATAPAILGLGGSFISTMKAFAYLGMAARGADFIRALGEVSTAFALGLFGSAVAMTLAAILWIVPFRKPLQPPSLPA